MEHKAFCGPHDSWHAFHSHALSSRVLITDFGKNQYTTQSHLATKSSRSCVIQSSAIRIQESTASYLLLDIYQAIWDCPWPWPIGHFFRPGRYVNAETLVRNLLLAERFLFGQPPANMDGPSICRNNGSHFWRSFKDHRAITSHQGRDRNQYGEPMQLLGKSSPYWFWDSVESRNGGVIYFMLWFETGILPRAFV